MFRKKKSIVGILMLIGAWELLTYATCEYFLPKKIYEQDYSKSYSTLSHSYTAMQWVDYFNASLFQALNIVGFAILLICIGYNLIKNRERIPSKE